MPWFSVIIPTRNRAHLLRYALQSVLAQTYDDYEIIVSDNHSDDDTSHVVRTFHCDRLRYVRSPTYLRMHDHWEFARQHARGEYLLFLADDDCLLKNALDTFACIIREQAPVIIGCRSVEYFAPDYWAVARRNYLHLEAFSNLLHIIDTRVALQECFRFNVHPYYYPRVTIPIARWLVESIAKTVGRFFDYPYPEYVGMISAYASIQQFVFLDKPLVVLGRTSDSLGPRYFWSKQDPTWHETLERSFQYVPLQGTFMTNGAAESFLRAKHNLPDRFEGIELSWVDYFRNYYMDMLTQRWLGRDIRTHLDEFYRVVDALPADLRRSVTDSIKQTDLRKPLWYKLVRRTRWLISKWMTSRTDSQAQGREYWINGNTIGGSDILSCVNWLDQPEHQTWDGIVSAATRIQARPPV